MQPLDSIKMLEQFSVIPEQYSLYMRPHHDTCTAIRDHPFDIIEYAALRDNMLNEGQPFAFSSLYGRSPYSIRPSCIDGRKQLHPRYFLFNFTDCGKPSEQTPKRQHSTKSKSNNDILEGNVQNAVDKSDIPKPPAFNSNAPNNNKSSASPENKIPIPSELPENKTPMPSESVGPNIDSDSSSLLNKLSLKRNSLRRSLDLLESHISQLEGEGNTDIEDNIISKLETDVDSVLSKKEESPQKKIN